MTTPVCVGVLYQLTELMKKSWWMRLTIPKFVYLNNRSIIHMIFGRMSGFVLKLAIINGTSAVDWWFAITMVRTFFLRVGAMSSPNSTTEMIIKLRLKLSRSHDP